MSSLGTCLQAGDGGAGTAGLLHPRFSFKPSPQVRSLIKGTSVYSFIAFHDLLACNKACVDHYELLCTQLCAFMLGEIHDD